MVGKDIDPSDIGKHSKIIKIAKKEMIQSDVIICGKCHNVFHFIEQFKEHKNGNKCDKESFLKDCHDTKPKLWAFLLWKSSQLNNNNNNITNMNSWNLYQQWIRMDESIRDTWLIAGRTILSFAKLEQGILQEMPVKITKTVVDQAINKNTTAATTGGQGNKPQLITQSRQQQQQQAADNKHPIIQQVIVKKDATKETDDTATPIKTIVTTDVSKGVRKIAGTPINQVGTIKSVTTGTATPSNSPLFTKNFNRRANRTVPNTNGQEFEEETIEKIIAKRYNPRRKIHEYLVKWEGFPHDQNTWEPQAHLECCPQLLETFEKQLARQKEQKAKAQAAAEAAASKQQQQLQTSPQQQNISSTTTSSPLSPNRVTISKASPTITTIQKSVKQSPIETSKKWIEDNESSNSGNVVITSSPGTGIGATSSVGGVTGGIKRKLEESDFENEFDDDDIPVHTVKKVKNGFAVSVKTDPPKHETRITPQPLQQQQSRTTIRTINGTAAKLVSTPPNDKNTSADVIITKDSSHNSGIFKKSGTVQLMTKSEAQIRVLSKGENVTSGIVRINASNNLSSSSPQLATTMMTDNNVIRIGSSGGGSGSSSVEQKLLSSGITVTTTNNAISQQQISSSPPAAAVIATRLVGGQNKVGTSNSVVNISGIQSGGQISQVQTHRIVMSPKDNQQVMKTSSTPITTVQQQQQTRNLHQTPRVGSISATSTPIGGSVAYQHHQVQTRTVQRSSPHTTNQIASRQQTSSPSPTSGKMIINKNVRTSSAKITIPAATVSTLNTLTSATTTSAITPEQKIIQLSKSGDLKVTRKVITHPISQTRTRTTTSSPQQQQQQQHQQQQISIQSQQQRHNLQQQQHPRTLSITKSEPEHSQSPPISSSESFNDSQQSPPRQFTLCEITGKVLRSGEESERKLQEITGNHEQQQQQANEVIQAQLSSVETDSQNQVTAAAEAFATGELALAEDGTHQYLTNSDGSPLLVTGEDGIIYQVAGKNADGQTILIAQDADGEQQFAYVSEETNENVITMAEAMHMLPKQQAEALAAASGGNAGGETQFIIKQEGDQTMVSGENATDGTTAALTQALTIHTGDAGDSQDGNIPAEVVQADNPSPGGTRRVILLLQDGTFMMTEMHNDEYKALNIV